MGCVCRAGPASGVFSFQPHQAPQQNINNHDMLDVLVEQPGRGGGRAAAVTCMPQSQQHQYSTNSYGEPSVHTADLCEQAG